MRFYLSASSHRGWRVPRQIFAAASRCGAFLLAAPLLLAQQAPPAEEDIRPPKPLIEIPETHAPPIALWSSIAAGVILLALIVWLLIRQFRKTKAPSPSDVALSSLTDLSSNRDQISAETFANRAADTIRKYIADRFQVVAPKLTTEEFLTTVAHEKGSSLASHSDELREFLKACDLAKFAGTTIDNDQRESLVKSARSFVRTTTPKPGTS